MNYQFPTINHINDVLPAIVGRDEFIVAERDDYDVINYLVNMEDTFDIDPLDTMDNYGKAIPKGIMRRECRGIMFYKDGTIMSRPFHKFFNVGERADTQIDQIDFSAPHTILVKEDGSMVRPLLINNGVRWGTKMGVTDTAMQAEVFVARNKHYNDFAHIMIERGLTPLFEYVGPDNRIVLEYETEDLVLLAVRDNVTGQYINDSDIQAAITAHDISLVKAIPSFDSLTKLIEYVRPLTGSEGFIVTFADGHRFKIKNDWYVRVHKVKDKIRTDRHVLDLILNNEIDDIMPHLDEKDNVRVVEFETTFWHKYHAKKEQLVQLHQDAIALYGTNRKDIALNFIPKLKSKMDARFIFGQLDGKSVQEMLLSHVKGSTSNTMKYEELINWI